MRVEAIRDTLAILDVGHGSSAVLIDRTGVVVIDTGPGGALLEFLDQQKIGRVDVVLISHADQDHIGALAQLVGCGRFQIGRIVLNSDASKDTAAWDDLLFELDKVHTQGKARFDVSLVEDPTPGFDQGRVHVDILGPSRYLVGRGTGAADRRRRRITSNSLSAAIRLSIGGESLALFLGDLDEVGLHDLLARHRDMRTHVLLFPHHGGKPGPSDIRMYVERLMKAVSPSTIVFSTGRGMYGTPDPDVMAAIRQVQPKASILCTELSEHCAKTLPGAEGAHLNRAFSRGREKGCCCAGTVFVRLTTPPQLVPAVDVHAAFVDCTVPNALCRR